MTSFREKVHPIRFLIPMFCEEGTLAVGGGVLVVYNSS